MWEKMLSEITDQVNISIINLLMEDGRMSDQLIANKIGISKTAVRNRRLNLQKMGMVRIVGILVLQNINFAYADLFVRFRSGVSPEEKDSFMSACLDDENVYEITQYIGEYDLVMRLLHKNPFKLKEKIDFILSLNSIVAESLILPATRSNKAWGVKLPNGGNSD